MVLSSASLAILRTCCCSMRGRWRRPTDFRPSFSSNEATFLDLNYEEWHQWHHETTLRSCSEACSPFWPRPKWKSERRRESSRENAHHDYFYQHQDYRNGLLQRSPRCVAVASLGPKQKLKLLYLDFLHNHPRPFLMWPPTEESADAFLPVHDTFNYLLKKARRSH